MKIAYKLILILILLTPVVFAENYTVQSNSYSFLMHTLGLEGAKITGSTISGRQILTGFQSGNSDSESETYSANVGFFGNFSNSTGLSIRSYSISPTSATVGTVIVLGISAMNSQTVWVKVTNPNGLSETFSLSNNGQTSYTSYVIGRHNVTFYANDSAGNIASAIDYFV